MSLYDERESTEILDLSAKLAQLIERLPPRS
jgi:hypothetical protein